MRHILECIKLTVMGYTVTDDTEGFVNDRAIFLFVYIRVDCCLSVVRP